MSDVLQHYAERVLYLQQREAQAFYRWLGCAAEPSLGGELEAYVEWQLFRSELDRASTVLHAERQHRARLCGGAL